jgi:ribosomal protein S18 acetylase RimI-like enzyme
MTIVRGMTAGDVPDVVALHMESFPRFFLTFLGRDFLKLLYESIVSDPQGVALVAVDGTRLSAFVAGVTQQSSFYSRLVRRRKWRFAMAAAGAVVRRPAVIPRLVRALRRPSEARQGAAEALLMSIGVSASARGSGIGRRLVDAFGSELVRRGIDRFSLVTDRDANDGANAFYRSTGFVLVRSYVTPEGRAMNEYLMRMV